MSTNGRSDYALRTISDDGSFRLLVATTAHTARGILLAQSPTGESRGLLADLVSATLLLRLTMSPDYRLQAIIQNRDVGSILADSHPDGTTRGLLRNPHEKPFEFGDHTQFAVHRAMYRGELHQGIVETSSGQSLSDVVTGYLDKSEQIASVVGLAQQFSGEKLIRAGGYIVQLLPDADDATLALMTARLQGMADTSEIFARHNYDPSAVVEELYGPIGFKQIGTDDFYPGCVCDSQRIIAALSTLPDADLKELLADDDYLAVDCEYCGKTHHILATALKR